MLQTFVSEEGLRLFGDGLHAELELLVKVPALQQAAEHVLGLAALVRLPHAVVAAVAFAAGRMDE